MRRALPLSIALLGALVGLGACAPAREPATSSDTTQVAEPSTPTATAHAPSDELTIATSQAMTEQAPIDLGLADSDYWDDPLKTRLQIENQLLDAERSVLVIGAPSKVAFQQRETLPLVVLRVGQQDAIARLPFRSTALVVAQELSSNTTYANMAVLDDAIVPPPYDGPPLEGMTGEAWVVELREQLGLPWGRGELLVSVIMRDTISHRVRVKLDKGGYQDPAVDEYLAQEASKSQPAAIHPPTRSQADDGKTLPTYRKQPESPPLPDSVGINLAVPRVIPRNPHMRCIVRGSFRLPVLPREKAGAGENHTAVVPITLLATGSDIPTPYQFDLKVPVYDPVQTEATGYFSIDLQSLANLDAVDQTLFIYAFSGEQVVGPVPMALVTR